MWSSRNKNDLIIEVWEKLDCESVGAVEIEAIEEAVSAEYGPAAVDSPMRLARLLANEGAELRHSEIMELWVVRHTDVPYTAEFRNIVKRSTFTEALASIRNLENLTRKFIIENDKEGLRLVREEALSAKQVALANAGNSKLETSKRAEQKEIAEWITIWLQSPEIFENWIGLRRNSKEFKEKFGEAMS